MLKYFSKYERLSESRLKTFKLILCSHLIMLKFFIVIVKLALLLSGPK